MNKSNRFLIAVSLLTVFCLGCVDNENQRLAEMAERNLERQAQQNQQLIELQKQVAEGSRKLVEADSKSREEMVTLQREIQAERATIGQQRDLLEIERKELAQQRQRDPIIAAAITNIGLLLLCCLPLVLCWYVLRNRPEQADDSLISEVLLQDMVANRPLLLPRLEAETKNKNDDRDLLDRISDQSD
jgi:hypothetical protein